MNNTLTINIPSTANYLAAADDVISILETLEFSTTEPFEPEMLRHSIAQAIRQNIEEIVTEMDDTEDENEPVSMEELLDGFRKDLEAENSGLCGPNCTDEVLEELCSNLSSLCSNDCDCHNETPDGLGDMGKNADGRL